MGLEIGVLPTGKWNAITDVPDVCVGQVTIIRGDGMLIIGKYRRDRIKNHISEPEDSLTPKQITFVT
ncbi:MAG TPA: hypothetical protein ENK14_13650 [Caldithrix sp.]|nr:hypothetical protein [Caldithrix sp.]